MGHVRDAVRALALRGASFTREVGGGLSDALRDLSAAGALEGDLELARRHGRWLSDEEKAQQVLVQRNERQRRRMLFLLLVLSVVLPPLWLTVPIWSGLLWWPQITRRLLMLALGLAGVGAVLLLCLLLWLVIR
jgi:hypothetical protein